MSRKVNGEGFIDWSDQNVLEISEKEVLSKANEMGLRLTPEEMNKIQVALNRQIGTAWTMLGSRIIKAATKGR